MSDTESFDLLGHRLSDGDPTWHAVVGAARVAEHEVSSIHAAVSQTLQVGMPDRLLRLKNTAGVLLKLMGGQQVPQQVAPDDVSSVLAYGGRKRLGELSRRIEQMRKRTNSDELVAGVADELSAVKAMLEWDEVKQVTAPAPRLTDFLRVGPAALHLGLDDQGVTRDEKFNILLAPSQFVPDLVDARRQCGLRDRSLVVAFIDIDKFKDINTKLDETTVDRDVLPVFMTRLEGFVFGRGRAYRQGGDEYLVILHNADQEAAEFLLDRLRGFLGTTKYGVHDVATTVSIGACIVGPDAPFTERQIERAANLAKDRAKDGGRDRVEFARPEDLQRAVDDT